MVREQKFYHEIWDELKISVRQYHAAIEFVNKNPIGVIWGHKTESTFFESIDLNYNESDLTGDELEILNSQKNNLQNPWKVFYKYLFCDTN